MSGEEEYGALLQVEALASENAQLKARVDELEAQNKELREALEEEQVPRHHAPSTFYNNSEDLARLIDELTELRNESRDQNHRIGSLVQENKQLRERFRLEQAVASPSRRPSRLSLIHISEPTRPY